MTLWPRHRGCRPREMACGLLLLLAIVRPSVAQDGCMSDEDPMAYLRQSASAGFDESAAIGLTHLHLGLLSRAAARASDQYFRWYRSDLAREVTRYGSPDPTRLSQALAFVVAGEQDSARSVWDDILRSKSDKLEGQRRIARSFTTEAEPNDPAAACVRVALGILRNEWPEDSIVSQLSAASDDRLTLITRGIATRDFDLLRRVVLDLGWTTVDDSWQVQADTVVATLTLYDPIRVHLEAVAHFLLAAEAFQHAGSDGGPYADLLNDFGAFSLWAAGDRSQLREFVTGRGCAAAYLTEGQQDVAGGSNQWELLASARVSAFGHSSLERGFRLYDDALTTAEGFPSETHRTAWIAFEKGIALLETMNYSPAEVALESAWRASSQVPDAWTSCLARMMAQVLSGPRYTGAEVLAGVQDRGLVALAALSHNAGQYKEVRRPRSGDESDAQHK